MNEVIGYVDVRSAEVATDAIAADVAQVHQDMLDADADASAAAASAAAAAGTLANAVKKTGEASQSIAGNIEVSGTLKSTGTLYATGDASVGGNLGVGGSTNVGDLTATGIVTVPTPTGNNYAANKKYVDDHHDATKIDITAINSYAVGLTGNQGPIAGTKTFTGTIEGGNINSSGGNLMLWGDQPFSKIQIKHRTDDATVAPASNVNYPNITWRDVNGVVLCVFTIVHNTDNTVSMIAQLRNTDGSNKYITLGRSDVI